METQISLEDQQHKARRRVNIGGTLFKDSLFDENIRITFYKYWLYTSPARVRPSTSGHRCPHGDVIKWKHFPCYWSFVRGIHRSPVTRSFGVFFYLHLHKRLSKQSWGWWFETPSRPLCRHSNADDLFESCGYTNPHQKLSIVLAWRARAN